MADKYPYRSGAGVQTAQHQQQHSTTTMSQPLAQRVVKTVGAATAGGSMMVLSGLTLVATVIGITVITPLLVIFSPVLVPAAITLFLIALGFASSGGFGLAAVSVMSWLYRYMTGKHPVGADQIDYARSSLAAKARDIKETVGQKLEQTQS